MRLPWEYDEEGNVVLRIDETPTGDIGDKVEFEWDHRNRLTKIVMSKDTEAGAGITWTVDRTVTFEYDAFDRRIEKRRINPGQGTPSLDNVSYYVYDGSDIVLRFDRDENLRNRYLHGPAVDQILAEEQYTSSGDPTEDPGATYWTATDHLGSVRQLIDNSSAEARRASYDVWGRPGTITGVVTIYGYTGREYDAETRFQYNRARYYDSVSHRWLSEDPLGLGPDENPYRYVHNQPTNYTDPSGMDLFPVGPAPGSAGGSIGGGSLGGGTDGLGDGLGRMYPPGTAPMAPPPVPGTLPPEFNPPPMPMPVLDPRTVREIVEELEFRRSGLEGAHVVNGEYRKYYKGKEYFYCDQQEIFIAMDARAGKDFADIPIPPDPPGQDMALDGIPGLGPAARAARAGRGARVLNKGGDAARILDNADGARDAVTAGNAAGDVSKTAKNAPKKPHGNTAGDQDATLYKKYDKDGTFQKHGVTQDTNKRYTKKQLDGGKVVPQEVGPRKEMLKKERELVETDPGPMNKEPWAGSRRNTE